MSESTAVTTAAAPAPPARPPREVRVVESAVGIMDTARFEHIGRVAGVIARAGLMPESLLTYKDEKGNIQWHDFETIQARAFLIVNQADLWKADPNAVAQCTSLVHGKLMYEGKLVHGLIETRLGIRLRYDFGTYDHAKRIVDVTKMPTGEDKSLGVIVTGRFPDEEFDRTIIGSVGMWETGAKGPWQKSTAWMRQLRYMGAREWCRAHSPGLLLGIMTDDEIDAQEEQRQERASRPVRAKADLKGRLAGPKDNPDAQEAQEGFSRAHVAQETGEGADQADSAQQDGGEAEPGETDAETEVEAEVQQEAEAAAQPDPEPEADPEPEPEATPEEEDQAPVEEAGVFAGKAPAGIIYMLSSDEPGRDDKFQTYQDGKPFSRLVVSEEALAKFPVYDEHPEGTGPVEADPEEVAKSIADAQVGPDAIPPDDEAEEEGQGPTLLEEIGAMTSWLQVKPRITVLYKDQRFIDLPAAEQNKVRAAIWRAVEKIKAAHKDPVAPSADPTAFRLWIETKKGADGADAIEAAFRGLQREAVFVGMPQDRQDSVRAVVEAKIKALRGE